MITLADVRHHPEIEALIDAGNAYLAALGYTEHGLRHVGYVSRVAGETLEKLEYSPEQQELARIAGWVHDVGNCVNRLNHGPNGALLLYPILRDMGMPLPDVLTVVTAVGNHEEETGTVSSAVSAALVLGDKTDAHRSRVRYGKPDPDDVHDRVNFAISKCHVSVDPESRVIRHVLQMDGTSSVTEYLAIYMKRITLCEHAAHFLHCRFALSINGLNIN